MVESTTKHIDFEINKLKDLHTQLRNDIVQYSELSKALQKEVSELREIIKKKENRIEKLEQSVDVLTYKLDDYEQYSRINTLRISGIPDEEEEDVMDKMMYLINTRLELSPPITPEQIDRTHRVGKFNAEKVRPILVKFATYRIRDQVFRNRKKLKTQNPRSAGDADARSCENDEHDLDNRNAYDNENEGVSGQPMAIQSTFDQTAMNNAKIFINEDLTKFRATLFWKLRNLVKSKHLRGCWTWDGRIFALDNYGNVKQVNDEQELRRLWNA